MCSLAGASQAGVVVAVGLSIVGGAGVAELVNFLDCRHFGHYKLLHWPLVLETVDFIGL